MIGYEDRLRQFIEGQGIEAAHLRFDRSCHSVAEAAEAAGVPPEDFVKNICLVDAAGNLIVAIVKGEDRASTSRVGKVLGIERPQVATPAEILEKTGYPVGGTPSFGYPAIFLVDPRVMDKRLVYSGGGSTRSLVRIAPAELLRANGGQVVRVRK
jgi:Cys-tRNA(Pro)/Cys-tRNA(Cys) deacylase